MEQFVKMKNFKAIQKSTMMYVSFNIHMIFQKMCEKNHEVSGADDEENEEEEN